MAINSFLSLLKSQLPQIAATQLGKVKAFAESRVREEIDQIIREVEQECPSSNAIASLSVKLNNLTNLTNKYQKSVQTVRKIPSTLNPVIQSTDVIVNLLSTLPLPSSVPPGIGIPVGVLNTQSEILVWARRTVSILEEDQQAILEMVDSVDTVFNPLRSKLTLVQQLLDRCADLTQEERAALVSRIRGGDREPIQANNTSEEYIADNGNTYVLEVEEEIETFGPTSRRRATAKDFRGIVVLRGPFSFASSTEILFDELKFRLDNNLP